MTRASGNPKHVPYTITTDVSDLPSLERAAISDIQSAMGNVNQLFRKMTRQSYFDGPFTFNPNAGVDFYPANIKKEEIDQFLEKNPKMRSSILHELTVVRRYSDGFQAVPYADHYRNHLEDIGRDLSHAADKINDTAFGAFLRTAAESCGTNNQDAADGKWLSVGSRLTESGFELNIGFHENDLDELFGVKRSVQAIFGRINNAETRKLRIIQRQLETFDVFLGKKYGYTPNRSPVNMIAIDELGNAGTALYHFVPAAYILPNSQAFRRTHGAKQVFCWGVTKARFDLVTAPIGRQLLSGEWRTALDLETLKLFVAAHECGHGTSFNFRGETFGALATSFEEGRADVVGLYALLHAAQRGTTSSKKQALAAVVVALVDGFRRLRFNINEAHAVGQVIQYNWLIEQRAIEFTGGKLELVPEHFLGSIADLCDEFYRLSASKDPEQLAAFVERWGDTDNLGEIAAKFSDLPIDLDPQYNITGL